LKLFVVRLPRLAGFNYCWIIEIVLVRKRGQQRSLTILATIKGEFVKANRAKWDHI